MCKTRGGDGCLYEHIMYYLNSGTEVLIQHEDSQLERACARKRHIVFLPGAKHLNPLLEGTPQDGVVPVVLVDHAGDVVDTEVVAQQTAEHWSTCSLLRTQNSCCHID